MVIGKNNRETTPPHQRERMANATEKQQRDKTATPDQRERKGATQIDVHSIGLAPGFERIMLFRSHGDSRDFGKILVRSSWHSLDGVRCREQFG